MSRLQSITIQSSCRFVFSFGWFIISIFKSNLGSALILQDGKTWVVWANFLTFRYQYSVLYQI